MQTGTAAKGREPAHSEKARILPFIIIIVTSFFYQIVTHMNIAASFLPKPPNLKHLGLFIAPKCVKSQNQLPCYTMKQGTRP